MICLVRQGDRLHHIADIRIRQLARSGTIGPDSCVFIKQGFVENFDIIQAIALGRSIATYLHQSASRLD